MGQDEFPRATVTWASAEWPRLYRSEGDVHSTIVTENGIEQPCAGGQFERVLLYD